MSEVATSIAELGPFGLQALPRNDVEFYHGSWHEIFLIGALRKAGLWDDGRSIRDIEPYLQPSLTHDGSVSSFQSNAPDTPDRLVIAYRNTLGDVDTAVKALGRIVLGQHSHQYRAVGEGGILIEQHVLLHWAAPSSDPEVAITQLPAWDQSYKNLIKLYPNIRFLPRDDTTQSAVELNSSKDGMVHEDPNDPTSRRVHAVAIASAAAGLALPNIVVGDVVSQPGNVTRFFIFERVDATKTLDLRMLPNRGAYMINVPDRVGGLRKAIEPWRKAGINLLDISYRFSNGDDLTFFIKAELKGNKEIEIHRTFLDIMGTTEGYRVEPVGIYADITDPEVMAAEIAGRTHQPIEPATYWMGRSDVTEIPEGSVGIHVTAKEHAGWLYDALVIFEEENVNLRHMSDLQVYADEERGFHFLLPPQSKTDTVVNKLQKAGFAVATQECSLKQAA